MKEAMAAVGCAGKLMVIVVTKMVSARFWVQEGSQLRNPPLGTVVDRGVTSQDTFDYYLLPCRATAGSMTPTHFHVVYDDFQAVVDPLFKLSYWLCF